LNNLIGFQTLVNRTLIAPGTSTTNVAGFNRKKINEYSQKIGELTHHDTITGTSVRAVVIQEAELIQRNLTSGREKIAEILMGRI
jgi:hypothetical protein